MNRRGVLAMVAALVWLATGCPAERSDTGEPGPSGVNNVVAPPGGMDGEAPGDEQPKGTPTDSTPPGEPSTPVEQPTPPTGQPAPMPVEIDCTAPGPGAGDQCSAETPCADGWTCSDALFAGQGAGTSSYYCYAEPDGAAGCAGSNEYALPFAPNGSAWGCVPLGHFRASFDLVVVQAGRQPGQRDMKPLTDYEADFSCEPYLQGMQRVQLGVEVAQDGLDVVQLSFSAIKLTPPTMQNVSVVIPSSRWVPGTTLELSPADPEAFGAQVVTAELALNGMQSSVKAATLEGLVAGGTVVIDEINGNGATGHVDIRFILVRAELDPDLMAM